MIPRWILPQQALCLSDIIASARVLVTQVPAGLPPEPHSSSLLSGQVPYIFHLPVSQRMNMRKMELARNQKMTFDNVNAKYPW